MKLNQFMLLLLLSCAAATAKAQLNYTIKGNLRGVKTPVKIFLYYSVDRSQVRDSVLSKDGKFSFSGTVIHPAAAYLYAYPADKVQQAAKVGDIAEAIDHAEIMLDGGITSIEGNDLSTAVIKGGRLQDDFVAYNKTIQLARDSVYQIWKLQQGVLPEDSAAAFKRLMFAQNIRVNKAQKDFVVQHPDSYVSYEAVIGSAYVIENPAEFEQLFNALGAEAKRTPQAKIVANRLAMAKKFAIGQPAENFSQMDDKGKVFSLADVKGKYVLIDFWASWCGPCRMEYPYLKKAYAQFKGKNFEIIGISLDDEKTAWLDAIKSNGFEWIELCDLKGRQNSVAEAYGVAAIPQNFLIDPQGKIIAKNLRGNDLIEKLEEVIKTM
jgi:peroxiredoxin